MDSKEEFGEQSKMSGFDARFMPSNLTSHAQINMRNAVSFGQSSEAHRAIDE